MDWDMDGRGCDKTKEQKDFDADFWQKPTGDFPDSINQYQKALPKVIEYGSWEGAQCNDTDDYSFWDRD